MSAIERRIADFILENAHLLRDYSSQQLAERAGHQPVERGEVQPEARLQGLPGPEVLDRRGDGARRRGARGAPRRSRANDPHAAARGDLWRSKARGRRGNACDQPARGRSSASPPCIGRAKRVLLIGLGEDGMPARAFAYRSSRCSASSTRAPLRSGADDGEHRRLPRRATCCWCSREHGKQTVAVPARAPVPRARRQGRLGHAAHRQSAARARGRRAAGVGARRARRTSSRCCTSRALQHLLDLLFVLLCEEQRRAAGAAAKPTPSASRTCSTHESRCPRRTQVWRPHPCRSADAARPMLLPAVARYLLLSTALASARRARRHRRACRRTPARAGHDAGLGRDPRHAAPLRARGRTTGDAVGEPTPVTIGRAGSAWGLGLHPAQRGPQKREGDGRAPAGVFRIGTAFGYADRPTTALPYDAMDARTTVHRRRRLAALQPHRRCARGRRRRGRRIHRTDAARPARRTATCATRSAS